MVNSVWNINKAENLKPLGKDEKIYLNKWNEEKSGAEYFKENYLDEIKSIFMGIGEFDFIFISWFSFKNQFVLSDKRINYFKRYDL